MRELNLDQLRTLVAVADLGTFSAAAQALHLAQPTVSLHISELESRMGTALLLRGSRRVQPSPAGAVLIERARTLLRDAGEAAEAVARHVEGRSGRVRLGTTTGVVVHLLPQVLEQMGREHPGIDVQVRIVGSNDGLQQLQAGTLDVGLLAMPVTTDDLVVSPWRRDAVLAFVPRAWAAPKRATPQWLASRPLIFNEPGTRLYQQTMEWFAAAGLVPRARIELNFTEAMKSLVGAGYGAAILPLENQAALRADLGIQGVPLKPPLVRHTAVVHRALPLLDGSARHLLAVLAQFRQG